MMFDLSKYGFSKYFENSASCFWEMNLHDTLTPSKIVVLSSVLSSGNWCYDIRIDSGEHSLVVANRYECETEEQLQFLLTGSIRLSPFILVQKHECQN